MWASWQSFLALTHKARPYDKQWVATYEVETLFGKFRVEDSVNGMLKIIRRSGLNLPERELCILATASVELMNDHGVDPSKEEVVIQTVSRCNVCAVSGPQTQHKPSSTKMCVGH